MQPCGVQTFQHTYQETTGFHTDPLQYSDSALFVLPSREIERLSKRSALPQPPTPCLNTWYIWTN